MDNLFKPLLIIILLAFLYMYYENSNNDRYSYQESGQQVFDKKTGTLYFRGRGLESKIYIRHTTVGRY